MDYATLEEWVNTNSGSHNSAGLRRMADLLERRLGSLKGELERIRLPRTTELDGTLLQAGDALRLRFNPQAPVRVLFSGHMDTVFDANHPFQRWRQLADGRINGPGVADMKGGLFIMIEVVEKYLRENPTGELGGEILITADEEIGSPASHELLLESARWNDIGLVFESSLPGGELVCRRKGTGTYRLTAHGRSAHTGRDFASGRNAVAALAALLLRCHGLNERFPDAIVNVGSFKGGGPVNVVPDHAEAWLNIRAGFKETVPAITKTLQEQILEVQDGWEGVEFAWEGGFTRPPKDETPADAELHDIWNEAERQLGHTPAGKRETGGSSDGNILGGAGLPHLDGIGIRGGSIHSREEFAWLESIPDQIDTTLGFLGLIASDPERIRRLSGKERQ